MAGVRRVVFAGAYGIRNAGDDAPLLVMCDALRRRHPEVDFEFTVLARHPDPELERAAGARFLPNLEHESRAAARARRLRGFNRGDDRSDRDALEAAIAAADLVIAGAGNALVDLTIDRLRGPVPLLWVYAVLAARHGTPFFLYGISAGPLATARGRRLSAWIARHSAAVTPRDRRSAALLEELAPGVALEVLPDPVLGLAPASDEEFAHALSAEGLPRRTSRPRLALALRELASLRPDEGHRERSLVVETLRSLATRWEFIFVPQSTYVECDDRREAEAVAGALGQASCRIVRGRHPPGVLMRFYETARATLAIRLHGAVFSSMRGVPAVALAYLPKVRGFMEEVGLGPACFELEQATPRVLAGAVERSLGLRAPLAQRCQELADLVPRHAERAGELLGLEPAAVRPARSGDVFPRTRAERR